MAPLTFRCSDLGEHILRRHTSHIQGTMDVQRGKFENLQIREQLQRALCATILHPGCQGSQQRFRGRACPFDSWEIQLELVEVTVCEYLHKGLVVSHYSWDRGIPSAMESKTRCLQHMVVAENRSFLRLLDWVIFTP